MGLALMVRRGTSTKRAGAAGSGLHLERVRPPWRGTTSEPIERASADDLMELATDAGPVPMQVGALLRLEWPASPASPASPAAGDIAAALGRRLLAFDRLRQRLVRVPLGCGRPIWIDDERLSPERHIETVSCPAPGGERELLAVTAERLARPLPADRPFWSATVVTGLADGSTGVVVVFHHVLADGLGGLAMLAALVDGMPDPPPPPPARPLPTIPALLADAARSALGSIRRLPAQLIDDLRTLRRLRRQRPDPAPHTSLNHPTGGQRALAILRLPLDEVRARAKADGGTVNDVVLALVTAALARLLRDRDEVVDHLVVSVPVAERAASGAELGNQVGVMPVSLPTVGEPGERLRAIAAITAARKGEARRSSAAIMVPVLRLLGAVHLLRPFIDHQHLINTFVTNLRGPQVPVAFCGATVTEVVPLTPTTGNVAVSFAVLSYAGTLDLVADFDPAAPLTADELVHALQVELNRVLRPSNPRNA